MPRLLFPVALFLLALSLGASAQALSAVNEPALIDTTITAGPPQGSVSEDEAPSFSFTATRDGLPFPEATFHCSVDGGPPTPCTSPDQLELETAGPHTFSVYAEDPETLARDPEPATRSFVLEFEQESEQEECGAGEEFEDEEGNVEECEEGARHGSIPPAECLLRTARARVLTYDSEEKLRLVIRYTSFAAANVDVQFRLGASNHSPKLGEARRRFAKRGFFRLTEKLSRSEIDRVRAARRFTVDLSLPAAPDFCRRYEARHLTTRRTVHSQVVWSQSGSVFGSAG